MRIPWKKATPVQLDLLSSETADRPALAPSVAQNSEPPVASVELAPMVAVSKHRDMASAPLLVAVDLLFEDPNNPRTEFPETELVELAEDIQQHGILQPIVVHPADAHGRHQIHFGAKRLRAAKRVGLVAVPIVIREAATNAYAQVAENQKRHGLTPHDLARFIKGQWMPVNPTPPLPNVWA
jgi:ParB family transcriptional regulator, chromosome partitioning protein